MNDSLCSRCQRAVNRSRVMHRVCDICQRPMHRLCMGITPVEFRALGINWSCPHCTNELHPILEREQAIDEGLCSVCNRVVGARCLQKTCCTCKKKIHRLCMGLTPTEFRKTNNYWSCQVCINQIFPFSGIDDDMVLDEFVEDLAELDISTQGDLNLVYPPINFDLEGVPGWNVDSLYYSVDELNNALLRKPLSAISLLQLNARSIRNKFDEVLKLLDSVHLKFTVISVVESWIKESDPPSCYEIHGYKKFSLLRKGKGGGGILTYVPEMAFCTVIPELSFINNHIEVSVAKLQINDTESVLICSVYKTHNGPFQSFLDEFDSILSKLNNQPTLIGGDFNIDIGKYESSPAALGLLTLLASYGYKPLINRPTRITSKGYSTIDNIYCNRMENAEFSGLLVSDLSDHFPVFSLGGRGSGLNTKSKGGEMVRMMSDDAAKRLANDLKYADWTAVTETNSAQEKYTFFWEIVRNSFERKCPLVSKRKLTPRPSKPWLSLHILRCCESKDYLYRKFLANRNEVNEEAYKKYRNRLTSEIRRAKINYYSKFFTENKDSGKIWQQLNSMMSRKKMPREPIEKITCPKTNITIKSTKGKCNALNSYFSEVGPELADRIPRGEGSCLSTMSPRNPHSLFLYAATEEEVSKVINSFDSKKSRDVYELNMDFVKKIAAPLIKPLTDIVNVSFSEGIFPSELKCAKIAPIFKQGSREVVSNYRPISLLPQFSKIFEKLFQLRLTNFLNKYKVITREQFGFRATHSTTHAIINFTDNVTNSLEMGNFTAAVFIDLAKAFDTIDHEILLKKLDWYGLRGVTGDWVRSYLNDRKQLVELSDPAGIRQCSNYREVRCGVPQGSLVGPIFFILYINDLVNSSNQLKFTLFADDTTILFSVPKSTDCSAIFNREMEKVTNWFSVNKLSLNTSKTKCMVFGRKTKVNFDPKIENVRINLEKSCKFLGVHVDSGLTWGPHIKLVALKLSRCCGVLCQLKRFLDSGVLRLIYYALFESIATYACEVWGRSAKCHMDRLIKLQKRAVRNICKSTFLAHTKPLFDRIKIEPLDQLVKSRTIVAFYKLINCVGPDVLVEKVLATKTNHWYTTRQCLGLRPPRARKNYRQNSFIVVGVKLWNKAPVMLRLENKLSKFKSKLKQIEL